MTEPTQRPDTPPDDDKPSRPRITFNRVVIWVLVGGFAIYLIVTGIVGIIAKSR